MLLQKCSLWQLLLTIVATASAISVSSDHSSSEKEDPTTTLTYPNHRDAEDRSAVYENGETENTSDEVNTAAENAPESINAHGLSDLKVKIDDEEDGLSENGTTRRPVVAKKPRTIPNRDADCCGASSSDKLSGSGSFVTGKQDKGLSSLRHVDNSNVDREGHGQGNRFTASRPVDERYNQGWRISNYPSTASKSYFDDRRPNYDRYGSGQVTETSRYGSSSPGSEQNRFGSGGSSAQVQSAESSRFGIAGHHRPSSYSNSYDHRYGYGSHDGPSRPSSNYGVSGNLGDGGEFSGPPGEYQYNGEGPPTGPHPGLHTQKAVALKALAGVALIGAAAALASNPVLIPISVLSGKKRRKRSTIVTMRPDEVEDESQYPLRILLENYLEPAPTNNSTETKQQAEASVRYETRSNSVNITESDKNDTSSSPSIAAGTTFTNQKLAISPQCVARLACHIQRDYINELEKHRANLTERQDASDDDESLSSITSLQRWFASLVRSNILDVDYVSEELKNLIRLAITVGLDTNEKCDRFVCQRTVQQH